MFGSVWDYYSSKLKGKQYKQNTWPKNYKIEIKILANPGLWIPGPEVTFMNLRHNSEQWSVARIDRKNIGFSGF